MSDALDWSLGKGKEMPIVKLSPNTKLAAHDYRSDDESYQQEGAESFDENSFTETERQMFALERFINSCPLPDQN